MKADSVFDVLNCLFIAIALAVTTLQRRAGDEIAICVSFYNDRKSQIPHDHIIGAQSYSTNQFRLQ